MALNSSGAIALAGSTAGQSIAVELGASATGQIALNDSNVRGLAGVSSGTIVMPTNFYGKSSGPALGTVVSDTYPWDISGYGGSSAGQYEPTNAMVWQMFYSRTTISFNTLNLWVSADGNNSWTWYVSDESTNPDYFGNNFSQFGNTITNVYYQSSLAGSVSGGKTISANKYFLIGVQTGPYFKMLRNAPTNRTLQGKVTAINRAFYKPNNQQSESPGIPTSLGGTSSSTEYAAIWQWQVGFT